MLEAGWVKVYHPGAAVRHAHDYGPLEFMRRYFDEYRGLREASGHVEPLRPARRPLARWHGDDRAGCASRGMSPASGRAGPRARSSTTAAAGWPRRSARVAERCRRALERRLSLEGRGAQRREPSRPAARAAAPCGPQPSGFEDVARLSRDGPAPLAAPVPGMSERPTARGGGDPALPARQRRPQHDLHAHGAARGAGPHVLDLALRPPRPHVRLGRGDPQADRRRVHAAPGARCIAASTTGTEPTSCSPPAGTPRTPPRSCRAAGPAPT